MSNTFKVSETLRQMALTDRKLSWLGGIAETVAELEEDNSRMARDIEAYRGAGEQYEKEIARKDAAIAEQARQLKEALAELEQVKRERGAALNDLKIADFWGNCQFCKYVGDHDAACETNDYLCCDCQEPTCACRTCANATRWHWRGPCAENGGTEDE